MLLAGGGRLPAVAERIRVGCVGFRFRSGVRLGVGHGLDDRVEPVVAATQLGAATRKDADVGDLTRGRELEASRNDVARSISSSASDV